MMRQKEKVLDARYVAPVFTPRTETGELNLDTIPRYVEFLIRNSIQGLLIGGSAGCGILQSNRERIVVAKAFIEASNGRLAIIVHTGGVNCEDTISLTREAAEMEGVDAVMLSAPMFFPYHTYQGLLTFLTDAGGAAGGTPVLYYHFPSLTRLEYDVVELMGDLKQALPGFLGLKYTADNRAVYERLVGLDIKIFLGFPTMTTTGAINQGEDVSLITGPSNFSNGVMMKIVKLAVEGDVDGANHLQEEFNNFMDKLVVEKELMSSLTYAMDLVGLPMGKPPLPLSKLTTHQQSKVKENLADRMGMLDSL